MFSKIKILLVMSLLLSQIGVYANENTLYYCNDDFSNMKVTDNFSAKGWIVNENKGTVRVIDTNEKSKALQLYFSGKSTGSTDHPLVERKLVENISCGKFTVEVAIKPESIDNNAQITIGDYEIKKYVLNAMFDATGSLTLNNQKIMPFEVGRWYQIKVDVDMDARKFDFYVGDQIIVNKMDFFTKDIKLVKYIGFAGWPKVGKEVRFSVGSVKAYSGNTSETTLVDTSTLDIKYKKAVEVLRGIGILADKVDFDKKITRAEFAVLISKLSGLGANDLSAYEQLTFDDVTIENPTRREIAYVNAKGLMNGTYSNLFSPDDAITYTQAIKVIVSLLNFDAYAQNEGGYPYGYQSIGTTKGITRNIDVPYQSELTYKDVLLLLYNSLEVNVLQHTKYGTVNDYEVIAGENILTEFLKLKKIKGIVTANSISGISLPIPVSKGNIEINKETYLTGDEDYNYLLGYNVEAYIKNYDDDDAEIVLIRPVERLNDVLNVSSEDIDEDRFDYNNRVFAYEDDKIVSIKSAYLVYNGVATGAALKMEYLNPQSGNVTLLDNNNDGEYDIVFVKSYESFVVKTVNIIDNEIIGQNGERLALIDNYSIFMDGEKIELSKIKAWNVIAILQSLNNDSQEIFVTNERVYGTIEEKDSESVIVGGQKYELSSFLSTELTINQAGVFYLDIQGKVIYYKYNVVMDEEQSGYLIKVSVGEGLATRFKFKILNSTGELLFLDGANTIRINGTSYTDGDAIKARLSETATDANEVNQVIKYTINSDNQITSINTNYYNSSYNKISRMYFSSGSLFYDINWQSPLYPYNNFILNNDTKIYNIPSLDADDDEYRVLPLNFFVDSKKYTVQGFNSNSNTVPEVVVVADSAIADLSTSDPIMVVDRVTQIINDNDVTVDKIYGYSKNTYLEFVEAKENVIENIKKGDVIRYSTDKNSNISKAELLFDLNKGNELKQINNYGTEDQMVYGALLSMEERDFAVLITLDDLTKKLPFKISEWGAVMLVYDKNSGKIYEAQSSELEGYTYEIYEGARIFIYSTKGGSARTIVLVK
jgi:hypothetical protein